MILPRIIVVANSSPSARAIEDFGEWSHMGNLLSDDTVLDARDNAMVFPGPWGKIKAGVQLRPPGYLQKENKRWAIFEFGTPQMYASWRNAGLSQIGKPYDSAGILAYVWGFFSGRHTDGNYDAQAPEKSRAWFCDAFSIFMASWGCHYLNLPPDYRPYDQTPGAALNLFIGHGSRCIASAG